MRRRIENPSVVAITLQGPQILRDAMHRMATRRGTTVSALARQILTQAVVEDGKVQTFTP